MAAYTQARARAETVNVSIRLVNALIAAKKAEAAGGDVAGAERRLAHSNATKKRHEGGLSAECVTYQRLNAEKAAAEGAKIGVRSRLEQHTAGVVRPYENRINAYLDAFNAGFRIAETRHTYPGGVAPTSSYQLVINATQVELGDGRTPINQPSFKNTLSAGDRSTLALAMFLAHLDRDPRRAQRSFSSTTRSKAKTPSAGGRLFTKSERSDSNAPR